MATALDPAIQKKLAAFARRWQRIVLWRGIAAFLAVLVGSLIALALLDRVVVMPDGLRLGLTAVAYAATMACVWWWSGRFLVRRPGPRELARLVERAEPGLREDLLSAIELGDTDATWDSPAFRELLMRDVAARILDVKPERVFPKEIVKRWLIAAGAAVVVCLVLLAIPPLRFNQLLLRAAAPMLDIERVSRFQIAIISPTAKTTLVPRGDVVPVTVNITGGRPYDVSLEVFPGNGRLERIAMTTTATEGQFTAALPVSGAELEFRVRADDAMTRRFKLGSRERPQALAFEKEIHFPNYLALAPSNVVEESGDLAAVEGSRVKLTLRADQPIAAGELQLTLANQPHVIPLKATAPDRLTAEVPVVTSGSYRVKLVAAETGFENKFSPEFEIRPEPDLVPRVELVTPKGNQMVAPDAMVSLLGSARDDFGLARVTRATRVNQEAWHEVELATNTTMATVVSQRWDILELNLQTGDQLALKLVATDTKGNRTETMPVQLTIVSSSFDPQRILSLDARRKALNAVESFARAARELERSAADLTRKAEQAGELQAQQAQLSLSNRIEEVSRNADAAWLELKLAVHQTRPGREGADLAQAGAPLARAKVQLLAAAHIPAPTDAEASRAARQEFNTTLRRAAESAESALQVQSHLLAAEEMDVGCERLATLQDETGRLQSRLTRPAGGTNDPLAEVIRRIPGLAAETGSIQPLLDQAAAHAGRNYAERVKTMRDAFNKQKDFLTSTSLEGKRATDVTGHLTLAARGFGNLRETFTRLKGDIAGQADQARATARRALATTSAQLEELWKYQETLASFEERAASRPGEDRPSKLRVEVSTRWAEAVAHAKLLAEMLEVRVDSDAAFVADLGTGAEVLRQLDALHNGTGGQRREAVEPVKRLAQSFRQLEAGHRFTDLVAAVRALAEQEHWEPLLATAVTARPRDWQWATTLLKAAPDELRQLKITLPSPDEVEQLARSTLVGGITVEMDARFRKSEAPHPQSEPLEQVLMRLAQFHAELLASLADAREIVRAAAPKLSERMDTLARAADALEKQTRAQAEATEKASEVNRSETTALADQQAELAAEIEELRNALRRDANAQNLMTPEGRERARDDDDASAMLRDPPQKATDYLRTAAAMRDKTNAVPTLQAAAQQQQLTAETLRKLAQHFSNAEMGRAELTRAELRAAEEALGIKSQLDEQYRQAEMLADLAKMSAEQQMQQLEEMLKDNPLMQQELSTISKSALKSAAGQLQQAAEEEKNLGSQLRTASMTENNDAARLVNQLKQLADDAARFSQQEVPAAAKAARDAALSADTAMETAAEAVKRAIAKLEEATSPADVSTLSTASAALRVAEEKLREAAGQATTAASQTTAVKNSQAQSTRAAQGASALAQRTSNLLKEAGSAGESKAQAMAKSTAQQQRVNQIADGAADAVARAARHEERLNNQASTERMESLASAVNELAKETLPPVAQALQKTPTAANVQPQIEAAQAAIETTAALLNQALGEGANGNQQQKPSGDAQAKNEAQQAARALDKLDQMMNGQKPSDQNSQDAAKQAAQQMAQAQQQAQKSQRTEGQLKEQVGTGAENYYTTAAGATGVLPALPNAPGGGIWGKLPPKMAQELTEGTREGVTGEYRSMVDTYFRVIADKARATAQ